jgi:alkanesulfonate monooxygenase SsuD/methylene tetrahydromethanopterin reductase-like flavin-dependent oxidoreductase (luciferase family)
MLQNDVNKTDGSAQQPRLSFGYLYDFRNPEQWRRPWNALYEETLDVVAWSETAGFRGAWVPEHHGADDGYMPTPNLALAAMAARTTTIGIGAAVGRRRRRRSDSSPGWPQVRSG